MQWICAIPTIATSSIRLSGGLLATSGVSYWRRRVSSDLEDRANARKRGLESLKGALERRR